MEVVSWEMVRRVERDCQMSGPVSFGIFSTQTFTDAHRSHLLLKDPPSRRVFKLGDLCQMEVKWASR